MNEHLAQQAFGTDDDGFIKGAFMQLSHLAVKNGEIDREQLDFIAGALVGIQPINTLGSMLAAQIVANHVMTMRLASRMQSATSNEAIEALEKMYTKLARTFPTQLEARFG